MLLLHATPDQGSAAVWDIQRRQSLLELLQQKILEPRTRGQLGAFSGAADSFSGLSFGMEDDSSPTKNSTVQSTAPLTECKCGMPLCICEAPKPEPAPVKNIGTIPSSITQSNPKPKKPARLRYSLKSPFFPSRPSIAVLRRHPPPDAPLPSPDSVATTGGAGPLQLVRI
nr:uncharacterized protein LOC117837830 [Setaria viridis]